MIISHEDEKVALVLSLTGIFTICSFFDESQSSIQGDLFVWGTC